jgi:hypothetical protein
MSLPVFSFIVILVAGPLESNAKSSAVSNPGDIEAEFQLYQEISWNDNKPDFSVFHFAIRGYNSLQDSTHMFKKNVLTIVDFSKPSNVNRLWVIDLDKKQVLLNILVAHGRNSGEVVANRFSNKRNSFQSSLGFYVTGSTYMGKHGLSLLLEGLERDINDQAKPRAIVVHGADYVSEKYIRYAGRIGRSQGCPAVSMSVHKQLINIIKNQTCIFIYAPDKYYFQHTKLLGPDSNEELWANDERFGTGWF